MVDIVTTNRATTSQSGGGSLNNTVLVDVKDDDDVVSPSLIVSSVMKEYIEQKLMTQYTGEVLLQRLFHMIVVMVATTTTTTTTTSSTKPTSTTGGSTGSSSDDELLLVLQWTGQKYIAIVQQTMNHLRYQDFYRMVVPLFPPSSLSTHQPLVPSYDPVWVQQQQQQRLPPTTTSMELSSSSSSPLAVLHQRLQTAQSLLNKDALRIAYMNLAFYYLHQYSTGTRSSSSSQNTTTTTPSTTTAFSTTTSSTASSRNKLLTTAALTSNNNYYHEALQQSMRCLDYCSTRYHTTTHTILMLVIALYMQNYTMIGEHIRRIQHNLIISNFTTTTTTTSGTGSTTTAASATTTTTATPKSTAATSAIDTTTIKIWQDKVYTIHALERLHHGDYSTAATKLRDIATSILHRVTTATATTTATTNNNGCTGSSPGNNMMDTTATTSTTGGTTTHTNNNVTTIEQLIQNENWDQMVLSPEDVVLYATVLTISVTASSGESGSNNSSAATIDTEHNRMIGLQFIENMKSFLSERTPIVYDILVSFYQKSDYKHAYELLEQYIFPILQYDIYFTQTSKSNNKTHLQTLQQMISTKCIVLYWNVYSECPLTTMMESLGSGIIGNATLPEFETLILQLLKSRFSLPLLSQDSTNNNNNTIVSFPMDTRYDYIHQKLVRTYDPYSSSSRNATANTDDEQTHQQHLEQTQLYNTSLQYYRTSQRVLDDTYSMLIHVPCFENDVCIGGNAGGTGTSSNYNVKSHHRPNRGRNSSNNNNHRMWYHSQQQDQVQVATAHQNHPYEMNMELQQQQNVVNMVNDIDSDNDDLMHNNNNNYLDDDIDMTMDDINAMNPEDLY